MGKGLRENFELSPDSVASKMRLEPRIALICIKPALPLLVLCDVIKNARYSHNVLFCILQSRELGRWTSLKIGLPDPFNRSDFHPAEQFMVVKLFDNYLIL